MGQLLPTLIVMAPFVGFVAIYAAIEWRRQKRNGRPPRGVARDDGNATLVHSSMGNVAGGTLPGDQASTIRITKNPQDYAKAMMPRGKTK